MDVSSVDTSPVEALTAAVEALTAERDRYRALYLKTLELCKRLELGLAGPKRERFVPSEAQLSLAVLETLLGEAEAKLAAAALPPSSPPPEKKPRPPPVGRKPLPAKLPRVDVTVLPPEVEAKGTDAFVRIGEEVTETVERRVASLVVVRTHRPKFVEKGRDALEACAVYQAPPPDLPLERSLAGPGLLADTVVRRWQDHLPLHRLERIYGREGLPWARSTLCGWHGALADVVKPLVDAMWKDALQAPYLCVDATGVLVQAKDACRRGHFWVVAAPETHVLFGYSKTHDSAAVDTFLPGYSGYLVADAHAVYNHLYAEGAVEVGCWSHARRYFFKCLSSEPDKAKEALSFIGSLFAWEREWVSLAPDARLRLRQEKSKPLLDAFFAWAQKEALTALDETPLQKALTYAYNQKAALRRFLDDGRLPLHNNFSERQLRREAVGRKNWLFLGSDDAGQVNATFVSLLASAQLHGLEPLAYLRDLFCLLPTWPARRVLELSPAAWNQTLQKPDTQQQLAANVFRQVSLGELVPHSQKK